MTAPVLLVGGGPGDPDLLTLRAQAALEAAGTVVTDPALADLATAFAPLAQVIPADNAEAAVESLRSGRPPVVRLYLGDPWLHPAHGAEAAALAAAGVATEAVPGISVEIGTATAAGVPTHHRHHRVHATLDLSPQAFSGATGAAARTGPDQRTGGPTGG